MIYIRIVMYFDKQIYMIYFIIYIHSILIVIRYTFYIYLSKRCLGWTRQKKNVINWRTRVLTTL